MDLMYTAIASGMSFWTVIPWVNQSDVQKNNQDLSGTYAMIGICISVKNF